MKQKFIDAHMKVAETYAQLSSAKRLQVGAVIVKDDTIIGIGYNGMPSGWDNECEHKTINLDDEYDYLDEDGTTYKLKTKDEVIHAESNALCKVTKSTNSSQDADMFVTHAPCIHCAKLIHQSGIRKVFYRNTYRDENGLKFLEKCGVEIEKV
jgi:dCMP deaminase